MVMIAYLYVHLFLLKPNLGLFSDVCIKVRQSEVRMLYINAYGDIAHLISFAPLDPKVCFVCKKNKCVETQGFHTFIALYKHDEMQHIALKVEWDLSVY